MKILKKTYTFIIFAFLYAPIAILMLYSFNDARSRSRWGGLTLRWYKELFNDSSIMSALLNTIIIALISATVSAVIGTFAALGIHFMGKRLKGIIMKITYIPVMNPDIVTGVSLMLLFMFLHIPSGYTTLILAHITFNIPYVILSVLPKLQQLNPHLFEAAEDLGAGFFYTFWKVILPEISSGIVTGFLLAITLSIDDFVVSFFTKGAGISTLSVLIYAMARKNVSPTINALSTIMFISVMIMLVIVNKRSKNEEAEN